MSVQAGVRWRVLEIPARQRRRRQTAGQRARLEKLLHRGYRVEDGTTTALGGRVGFEARDACGVEPVSQSLRTRNGIQMRWNQGFRQLVQRGQSGRRSSVCIHNSSFETNYVQTPTVRPSPPRQGVFRKWVVFQKTFSAADFKERKLSGKVIFPPPAGLKPAPQADKQGWFWPGSGILAHPSWLWTSHHRSCSREIRRHDGRRRVAGHKLLRFPALFQS